MVLETFDLIIKFTIMEKFFGLSFSLLGSKFNVVEIINDKFYGLNVYKFI